MDRINAKGPLTPDERVAIHQWLDMGGSRRPYWTVPELLERGGAAPREMVRYYERTFEPRLFSNGQGVTLLVAIETSENSPYIRLEGGLWLNLHTRDVITDERFRIGEIAEDAIIEPGQRIRVVPEPLRLTVKLPTD